MFSFSLKFLVATYLIHENCFSKFVQVYPQMVGLAQARAVLPLDREQGIPMFVNAKQYHAILRRRQTRAKLEAQNKVARTRKVLTTDTEPDTFSIPNSQSY